MHHILICTTSYPESSHASGSEAAGSFVADFASALSEHARVTVVAPGTETSHEKKGNLWVKRFAVPSLPLSLLKPTTPSNWPAILKTLRAGQKAVREAAEEENIDHIFALWALPSGYWARRVAREKNIPYSIWTLGSDIWTLGKIPIIKSILGKVLHESSKCYADGYILADDTSRIGNCPCDFLPSTRTLPVKEKKVLSEQPPYKLAFLGRWHPNKGADILVDALGLLEDSHWEKIKEVRYCGGGPLEAEIVPKIEALQQKGRALTLKGYLDQDEALELFMWADYLMIPSRIESIPVVFSDAMQTMTPVICSPVGDLPRLLKGCNIGVLSDNSSVTGFAKAICKASNIQPSSFITGLHKTQQQFSCKNSVKFFLRNLLVSQNKNPIIYGKR